MHKIRDLLKSDLSEIIKVISNWTSGTPLWHPLGFVSLPLNEGDNWSLKLHYWPKGIRKAKKPDWPIHNHRFNIQSRILYGRVENWIYDIIKEGEQHLFPVVYNGKNSILKSNTANVTPILLKKEIYKAGDIFSLNKEVFHQAHVPIDKMAMTIVLQSDIVKTPPNVIGKKGVEIEEYILSLPHFNGYIK